ncbi:hypothetical protein ABTL21_19640, partial [Acinetobacter baumannii]
HGPDLPDGLAAVVARMMARRPDDRFATAKDVMRALLPYLPGDRPPGPASPPPAGPVRRALVADDEPELRAFSQLALRAAGFTCAAA